MELRIWNMVNRTPTIKSFKDLEVWQEGHNLVLLVYKYSNNFPSSEMFGLTSQIRRAAVSVTSNLAEGFTKESLRDKINFFLISRGSLTELESQLLIAKDLKYINEKEFNSVSMKLLSVHKLLNAFIRSTKEYAPHSAFHIPHSKQRGFTLIEALVAAAVFTFVVSATVGVYLSVTRIDAKTRAQRAVSADGRFIMEILAKEIRNGVIDYSGSGCTNGSNTICLINQDGEFVRITYDGSSILTMARPAGTSQLNSAQVRVTSFTSALYPSSDPYTLANGEDTQPYITLSMQLDSNFTTASADSARLPLQSTFAVRYYPERE